MEKTRWNYIWHDSPQFEALGLRICSEKEKNKRHNVMESLINRWQIWLMIDNNGCKRNEAMHKRHNKSVVMSCESVCSDTQIDGFVQL